jgi:hypothetical protein
MGARTVGKGRGSVFVGGVRYDEGATIPSDVNVGDHVFDDVDEVEGNIAMEAPKIVTVGPTESVDGDGGSGPADGNVDEILDRVGDDPAAAAEALAAEQAKSKPRKSLVEKLQSIVDGDGGSGSGS